MAWLILVGSDFKKPYFLLYSDISIWAIKNRIGKIIEEPGILQYMPFNVDSLLLKCFIAVAETGSFSKAANIVGRTQSAISVQIKKLEQSLNCALFERNSRKVLLTQDGKLFLDYARRALEMQWEIYSRLRETEIHGEINLGTPEDFATHYLPRILSSFAKHHPFVQLNTRCDLTLNLLRDFNKGELDIVLVKRDPEKVKGGTKVWKEPLVWASAHDYRLKDPITLALAPHPCIYRARAIAALDRMKKNWRIAYTSPSLAGTVAAVKAGLGITVLPANMLPQGLFAIKDTHKLPALAASEIALMKQDSLSPAAKMLVSHIVSSLETSSSYHV